MLIRSLCPSAALVLLIFASGALAGPSTVEKSEEVIGKRAPNYRLTNQEGQFVALHSLKGKYSLVSFIYVNCPGPCIAITQSVANLFRKMDPKILMSVQGLTITIDSANDTSEKLKAYGLEFTDNLENWTFARADEETVQRLSADLGFFFEKKDEGWFEHMNRLTLLGPDMTILAHFYGTEFDPVQVEEAIRDSMEGRSVKNKLKDTLDYALVFCSNYDPVSGTYKVDYKFLMVIIIQDLLALATLVYFARHRLIKIFSRLTGGRIKSAS